MLQFGDHFNFWVSLAIFVAGSAYIFPLRSDMKKQANWRHYERTVFNAYVLWVFSALMWAAIYAFRWAGRKFEPIEDDLWELLIERAIIQIPLDLNSTFLLIAAVCLIWGKDLSVLGGWIVAGLVAASVVIFDSIGMVLGSALASDPELLPQAWLDQTNAFMAPWSSALAVAGPICLGWALLFRFRTKWITMLAVAYAMFQPAAFGFAFVLPEGRPSTAFTRAALQFDDASLDSYAKLMGSTENTFEYQVRRVVEGNPLTDVEEAIVFKEIEKVKKSTSSYFWFSLQFHLSDLLFGVLAVLKATIAVALITLFNTKYPASFDAPPRTPPANPNTPSFAGKAIAVALAIACAAILSTCLRLNGVPVKTQAVPFGVVGGTIGAIVGFWNTFGRRAMVRLKSALVRRPED